MEDYTIFKKRWLYLLGLFTFLSLSTLHSQPLSGWVRPGACNTGPYNEAILTSSGTIQVYTADAVIENVDVTGMIKIYANNVTIKNFRVNANGAYYAIRLYDGATGLTIEDGEIYNHTAEAITPASNFIARRIEVHEGDGDGFKASSGTIIESCWFHHLGKADGSHADGIQVTGGSNITIRGNYFEGYPYSDPYSWNAAAMIKTDNYYIDNVVFENNWSDGGNYQVNIAENSLKPYGCPTGIIIRNNHFGGHATGGYLATHDCGVTTSNNLVDPGGTSTIPACGVGSSGGSTVSVTGVTVSPTTLSLSTGQSTDLTETVSPANATNQSVNWSSSNTLVATVNSNGLVTAVTAGNSTITVTTVDGGYTANCSVTVTAAGGSLPSPWANGDIGAVGATGSASYSNDVFTVNGSGSNIWNTADEFQFVYQQITGDAIITARITSLTNPSAWTKGGVMMRETLNANSVNGNTFLVPVTTNGSKFSYRATTGATSSEIDGPDVTAPYWLRMERSGNTFIGSVSANGSTWTTLGSTTISMSSTYYVGLSVSSLADGTLATATFDNVTVTETTPPVSSVYYCSPTGSMSNNGTSAATPWAKLQDVIAAGKTFNDGDIIYLMSGNHGTPVISEGNGDVVTITKVPGETPILTSIKFSGASNWLLSDVKINPEVQFPNQSVPLTHPVFPIFENSMVQIEQSSDITINNCYMISFENVSAWTANDWNYKAWNGVYIKDNSQDITISQNNIKNVNFGVQASSCANALIEYNTIENFCGDGIRPDTHGAVVQYNIVKNAYDTNGNHDDLLQVFLYNITGLEIRGNILLNYTDPNQPFRGSAQGISLFDGMHYNCIIENNVVVSDHWNGIVILGIENSIIVNNTLIDPNDTGNGPPWLQVDAQKAELGGNPSINNIVSNNLCTDYKLAAGIGVTQNNIEFAWSARDTYFNDFANWDLSLKAGSPAIDAGTSTNAPTIDIIGTTRPQGSAVDAGAYEYISVFVPVTGVQVSPTTLDLNEGGNSTLTATVLPASASNKSVTWSSSATSVATVNSSGLVTAVAAGNATITVTTVDGGYTATCSVTVTAGGASITLNSVADAYVRNGTYADDNYGTSADLAVKTASTSYTRESFLKFDLSSVSSPTSATLRLYAVTADASASETLYLVNDNTWTETGITYSNKPASGSALNSSVSPVTGTYVEIDILSTVQAQAGGLLSLQLVGNGGEYVSYSSKEGANAPELVITTSGSSIPVTGISVSPTTLNLNAGQSADLTETITPSNATNQSVSWTTSNASVATVDANGLVTAVDGGNCTITVASVESPSILATCSVTVTVPVTSIQISDATLGLLEGGSATLSATVLPANASNPSVTWSSSATSIATVDANGNVSAILEGNCTITVTSVSNPSISATCAVSVTALVGETTVTLNSIADAYVRGGTYADDNYGSSADLAVKTASASYIRESFLKFDLSAISNPTSATLRLYANTVNSTQTLYLVNDNSWTESGITYSNKPASGSVINASVSPVAGTYVEVDILSTVQAQAGGLLSLQLVGNGDTYTAYSSKEGANAPELVITSGTAAPVALIDEDFSAGASDFTVIAGGTWAVSGGSYVLSNPGDAAVGLLGNISVHNTEVTGDFELNTMINITGTTSSWNDAAVVFNHQGVGANSYYYVSLNESNDGNTSGIFKVVNGTPTELCDITTAATTGVNYNLQIIKTGSNIVVNLNGSQIASATDATLTDGFVGYGSKNDGATFDNLVVWASGSSSSGKLENVPAESGAVNNISSVKIYPNPLNSDNPLNIKLEGYDTYDIVNVNIIDLAGHSVYNQLQMVDKSELKITVNNLTRGVYIVSLTGNGINKQQKLIVE